MRYDRNAACPCGSGAKAKRCCKGRVEKEIREQVEGVERSHEALDPQIWGREGMKTASPQVLLLVDVDPAMSEREVRAHVRRMVEPALETRAPFVIWLTIVGFDGDYRELWQIEEGCAAVIRGACAIWEVLDTIVCLEPGTLEPWSYIARESAIVIVNTLNPSVSGPPRQAVDVLINGLDYDIAVATAHMLALGCEDGNVLRSQGDGSVGDYRYLPFCDDPGGLSGHWIQVKR